MWNLSAPAAWTAMRSRLASVPSLRLPDGIGDDGAEVPVTANGLVGLLTAAAPMLRLAFVTACWTAPLARRLAGGRLRGGDRPRHRR